MDKEGWNLMKYKIKRPGIVRARKNDSAHSNTTWTPAIAAG